MSLFPGSRVQGQVCLTRGDAHSCQDLGSGAPDRPIGSHARFGHVHTALTRKPPRLPLRVEVRPPGSQLLDCPCRFHPEEQPAANCSVCHRLVSEKVLVFVQLGCVTAARLFARSPLAQFFACFRPTVGYNYYNPVRLALLYYY